MAIGRLCCFIFVVFLPCFFSSTALANSSYFVDLRTARDGALLRDPNLADRWWLSLRQFYEQTPQQVLADPWVQEQGFRYATSDELCELMLHYGIAPYPCPGSLVLDQGLQIGGDLQNDFLIDLMRVTFYDLELDVDNDGNPVFKTRSDGVFDSGTGPGLWGIAETARFVDNARTETWMEMNLLPGVFADTESRSRTGHFLILDNPQVQWPSLIDTGQASARNVCELGATPYDDGIESGVTFRVWAPNAERVAVIDMGLLGLDPDLYGAGDKGFSTYLERETEVYPQCWREAPAGFVRENIFSVDVPGASAGSEYRYLTAILGQDTPWLRRDPRGKRVTTSDLQNGNLGNSIVVDAHSFDWQGHPGPNGQPYRSPPLAQWIMYEDTLLPFNEFNCSGSEARDSVCGRFEGAKRLGINNLFFQPIQEFPSKDDVNGCNLGGNPFAVYDPFALEVDFGTPDDLAKSGARA